MAGDDGKPAKPKGAPNGGSATHGTDDDAAKNVTDALLFKGLKDFIQQLSLAFENRRGNAEAWRLFSHELSRHFAREAYTVRSYVGQTNLLTISRLGSKLIMTIEFAKEKGDPPAEPTFKCTTLDGQNYSRAPQWAQELMERWRLQGDISSLLIKEVSEHLVRSEGRMSRRAGDRGLDKQRLNAAFEYAASKGFVSLDGRKIRGEAAIEGLAAQVNKYNADNGIAYDVSVKRAAPKSTTYLAEVHMGESHTYNFKMTISSGHAKLHGEFGALHGKGSEDWRMALAARIPSVSRNAGLASQSVVQQRFVLPEMMLQSEMTAQAMVQEPRFASESVAEGKTFREIQSMLNTAEGRTEARKIVESALGMPEGSDVADLLEAARKQAGNGGKSAAILAIVQALI